MGEIAVQVANLEGLLLSLSALVAVASAVCVVDQPAEPVLEVV